jgi:hypothetical protein
MFRQNSDRPAQPCSILFCLAETAVSRNGNSAKVAFYVKYTYVTNKLPLHILLDYSFNQYMQLENLKKP